MSDATLKAAFEQGLSYKEFLERHGTPPQREKWQAMHARIKLTDAQKSLLGSFKRKMPILCMAGAWCGDCVEQCPIFDHFAAATNTIDLRFIDRDANEQLKQELTTCGGARVPTVVFFNEDLEFVHRMGDRTLSRYRAKLETETGPSCPTGIGGPSDELLALMIQEWLNEFERVQILLRLSAKLRQRHND